MRLFKSFSLLSCLLVSVSSRNVLHPKDLAPNIWGPYQIVEKHQHVPEGWKYQGPASNDTILRLQLVVKANELNDLDAKLMQISTPGHASYGKHLNQEQLAEFVAPNPASIEFISKWLSSFAGLQQIAFQGESSSISFEVTAAAAKEILKADFSVYREEKGSKTIIRTSQYSLPEAIKQHTTLIYPTTYFPRLRAFDRTLPVEKAETRDSWASTLLQRRDVRPEVLSACYRGIYPGCIAALYNIDYTPPVNATPSGSSLGIAGFLEEYINHTDVKSFVQKYGIAESTRANPGTFSVELVNGGINDESSAGIEATLDMEYSMPFTGSLPVTYYSTAGRPPTLGANGQNLSAADSDDEPFLEWVTYLLAKADDELPQVISISYTDTEQTVPQAYALHVCDMFGRLAARGVSVIDASGDGGVAGTRFDDCVSNDGKNTKKFLPTFPASCPWVTAVGSTSVVSAEEGSSFSAGGFSNYFATPDYQRNATASYISFLNGQYSGLYNSSGRGIPDVALFGSHYETENNNVSSRAHSGTSAGTPVFAAMIALVNDIRLREGKPVLGWLNPLLYSVQMENVWNDITQGGSYGCDSSWNAAVGWDAVTGLGSPDFQRLVKALS